MNRKAKGAMLVMVAVLLVGLAASLQLTYIHFMVADADTNYKSFCNISETINCDTVAASPWSTLFGIPIAILGGLTYLFCIALAGARLALPRQRLPHAGVHLFWIAVFCVAYSLYLAYVCYAEIGAWCLMCMVLYAVNVVFLLTAWVANDVALLRHFSVLLENARWIFGSGRRVGAVAFVLIAVAGMFAFGIYHERQTEREVLDAVEKKLTQLAAPIPVAGNVLANPEGKISVMIFSDYQCPYCQRMERVLEDLAKKYREMKLLRRDFPLDQGCNPMLTRPFHPHACDASRHALCSAKQGKYEAFHEQLLLHQKEIGPDFFKRTIVALGLDAAGMAMCLTSQETADRLSVDVQQGMALKLAGTPALVFDGRELMVGAMTKAEVERLIQIKMRRL
ncbi:MAG: hypothetical protein C4523_13400 [Myxococcales bacterium]|nr:MAG: hypothetical protein C4523_13400 [Myxococcales bacterium]